MSSRSLGGAVSAGVTGSGLLSTSWMLNPCSCLFSPSCDSSFHSCLSLGHSLESLQCRVPCHSWFCTLCLLHKAPCFCNNSACPFCTSLDFVIFLSARDQLLLPSTYWLDVQRILLELTPFIDDLPSLIEQTTFCLLGVLRPYFLVRPRTSYQTSV